jgi:hypothetical protein
MVGALPAALTVMLMVSVPLPKLLVAVIVWVVADWIVVGVPEITQVVAAMLSPDGSEGDAVHLVGVSPDRFGVKLVMTEFCV